MDLKLVYMINPPSLIPSWSFCFLLSKKILKCFGALDNMLSQFPTYWFAWCFKYIFAVISVESWVYVHSIISNGRFLKGPWALAEVRQSRLGSREERLEFVVLRRELMSLMKGSCQDPSPTPQRPSFLGGALHSIFLLFYSESTQSAHYQVSRAHISVVLT